MNQLQQNRLPERFYDEPFALCFSGQGFDWISSLREALADGARDRANEVAAEAARTDNADGFGSNFYATQQHNARVYCAHVLPQVYACAAQIENAQELLDVPLELY